MLCDFLFVSCFPDKNRFGQKILEKFGWSPGDGLGAQKQGIKEHLKPKRKSDNAGDFRFQHIFVYDMSIN